MCYVLTSVWSFPFGGGEEYLYQTLKWTNMQNYWISFSDAKNKPYDQLIIEKTEYCTFIKLPGGFVEENLYNWLKLLKPTVIHHQGHMREAFYTAAQRLRVEFISGFHFWTGAIILSPVYKNIDIIKNIGEHEVDPELKRLAVAPNCTLYTVSKYVQECIDKISGINIKDLVYSGSDRNAVYVTGIEPSKNKYVTVINIHKLKGGDIILKLLEDERLSHIPFLLIRTEYESEDLDEKIKKRIELRNSNIKDSDVPSMLLGRVSDIKAIFSKTKIFLAPSLVDETFCRTVNEAMVNKIPVLTTGQGNLRYLLGDNQNYIINPEDTETWCTKVLTLYDDKSEYLKASDDMLGLYDEYSSENCEKMFKELLTKVVTRGKDKNIMIMTPWCDQGLGIQSKNYYKILSENGYNVCIFAIKPYNANTCIELQKDPKQWVIDNVYYSPNDREHVKDYEIVDFVRKYNIGKCIIPEICWFRVFEIAKLLREIDVKCYAIPNVEIVRKDELYKFSYFHKILCNNKICEDLMKSNRIMNSKYVGYGIDEKEIQFRFKTYTDEIKFLFIGGMNAFSRKHILEICEAFAEAYEQNDKISLTCTIQKTNLLETEDINKLQKFIGHPGIYFIQEHLKYSDIITMYHNHHISIQVSKHEGLGLGFYESLATGTPIITLDTPPHNEIVEDGVNGWIIPCYLKPMTDNPMGLFGSAYFDVRDLSDKIVKICSEENREDLNKLMTSLMIDYHKRLRYDIFVKKFIKSLNT